MAREIRTGTAIERSSESFALHGGPKVLAAMEGNSETSVATTERAAIVSGLQAIMPALLNGEAAAAQLDGNGNGNVTGTTINTTQ